MYVKRHTFNSKKFFNSPKRFTSDVPAVGRIKFSMAQKIFKKCQFGDVPVGRSAS